MMTQQVQRRARSDRRKGFTLVELMVALALGAIISVVISIISTSARESYSTTVAKVDVYGRFRLAFNTLQKDFAGWIPTQELEPYIDGAGGRPRDFHWQPGERVRDRKDEFGGGVVDGGVTGEYDEFAFIEQKQYRSLEFVQLESADSTEKYHDAYHCYFKTMTYVDGAIREANVEYFLGDSGIPREKWKNGVPPAPTVVDKNGVKDLTLFKVVRYFVIDKNTITNLASYPIKRRILEIATNVTDFRVEYMTNNPFKRRSVSDFVTPEADYQKPSEIATRPTKLKSKTPGLKETFRKVFGYGSMNIDKRYERATAYSALWGDNQLGKQGHDPVRFGFQRNQNISFSQLGVGDRIYIFTNATAGLSAGAGGGAGGLVRFPAGDYTIKGNFGGLLEFVEDVDASSWGRQDQRPVNYKAAFLPSAVRLTIRMVDDSGKSPKVMQQVVWLRRRSN